MEMEQDKKSIGGGGRAKMEIVIKAGVCKAEIRPKGLDNTIGYAVTIKV